MIGGWSGSHALQVLQENDRSLVHLILQLSMGEKAFDAVPLKSTGKSPSPEDRPQQQEAPTPMEQGLPEPPHHLSYSLRNGLVKQLVTSNLADQDNNLVVTVFADASGKVEGPRRLDRRVSAEAALAGFREALERADVRKALGKRVAHVTMLGTTEDMNPLSVCLLGTDQIVG